MIYICSPTSAVRLLPPPAILAAAYRLAHLLSSLKKPFHQYRFWPQAYQVFPTLNRKSRYRRGACGVAETVKFADHVAYRV